MSYQINKVGIIGAGTMGGGIAAHLANIGIPVVLLDIPTPGLSEEENTRANRNKLVQGAYKRMTKARPANLASKDRGDLITVGNTEDDFDLLADCDWIVEVIIERLAPKQALMERLEATVKPTAIVTSNTSGIPINEIAQGRSAEFKARFLGTHFFNPPRYLKLLEIIPTPDTAPEVTEFMADFGRNVLGKGVVICKDSPNFIGNRFMSITGAYVTEYALEHGYTIPEVDSLTGPLIGRPKTGTYRLTDLVGLDIMMYVSENLYPAIPHDIYRDTMKGDKSARVANHLKENGWLGNKSGQGFYKKSKDENGKRIFLTLNPETLEYELAPKARFDSVGKVRKIEDLSKRLNGLLEHDDRASRFVRDVLYFNLAYAAYVTPEIAYSIDDMDNAQKWGFAHEAGPFEIWDMLGVAETAEKMEESGYQVADWVKEMLGKGHSSFYDNGSVYSFETGSYTKKPIDKNVVLAKSCDVVDKNGSAKLRDMGDGILLLEFDSKMNAIDPDILAMANKAVDHLEGGWDGLVIGNNGKDFCVGANLALIGMAAAQGMWDMVENMIHDGQKTMMRLKHAPKPVVTAPHQRVLGGGVEMTMHSWATVADHETYMGLVEVGVGIVPAWGGCKETLLRKVNPVMRTANADVVPVMQDVFEQIATAKVGESAHQDRQLGYIRHDDEIVFNSDHRLAKAKAVALGLARSGVKPPANEKVYAAGRDVYYALLLGLKSFGWGGYATPHDLTIGKKLAWVLCGGDLSAGTWVDPWHILDLEREAILSLSGTAETQARVVHMLEHGKPLRN